MKKKSVHLNPLLYGLKNLGLRSVFVPPFSSLSIVDSIPNEFTVHCATSNCEKGRKSRRYWNVAELAADYRRAILCLVKAYAAAAFGLSSMLRRQVRRKPKIAGISSATEYALY
jgi:hypothetical protein